MKAFNIVTLTGVLMTLPLAAAADVPHTFVAGEAASAAQVNENFQSLAERIAALEAASGTAELNESALVGDYRLQISGALYEFFNRLEDAETIDATSWRDFLVAGTLTLSGSGELSYVIDGNLEPIIFLGRFGGIDDDTSIDGLPGETNETIPGDWAFNTESQLIEATIFGDDGEDGLFVELHISRDLNSLMGAVFIAETEFEAEFNEEITEYEIINFNAIRLKD
ncbi:MAG: hypothetical protein EA349_11700 [Halomonadaceae bacterium]|nr:MAG: hypothetical protein EA349_11700 [Halomonadaceae bacterium]